MPIPWLGLDVEQGVERPKVAESQRIGRRGRFIGGQKVISMFGRDRNVLEKEGTEDTLNRDRRGPGRILIMRGETSKSD